MSSALIAARDALRAGRMVLVVDGTDVEAAGYLVVAAAEATASSIAFMVRHTSGVLCVALDAAACSRMELPQMVRHNENTVQAAFTVSVDAKSGVTTGISAADRATTIRLLADFRTGAADLSRPGHVFPLRARSGGVLARPRYTEAAVDLAVMAGLPPAAAMAALTNDDCAPVTESDVTNFAARHHLPVVAIADLVDFRSAGPAPSVRSKPQSVQSQISGHRQ